MGKIYTIIILALLAGGCSRDADAPARDDLPRVQTLPNAELELLRQNYHGVPFVITEDMVFEGFVTANDRSGNFFRSFMIDDGTAAVELRAGTYDLHSLYPVGRRLVLHAAGLAVGMYNGVIQLGPRIAANSQSVDEFGFQWSLDRHLERDAELRQVEPLPLEEALATGACGRLVRTGRVKRLTGSPECWADPQSVRYGSHAEVLFRDAHGDTLCVATSRYADFASERVPNDSISLCGILLYGNFGSGARYALKIRDLDDVYY